MFNVVVYNNDEEERELIEKIIVGKSKENICNNITGYTNFLNYIRYFSDEQNVYFLSIRNRESSGFELAEKIRKTDKEALIIFIDDDYSHVRKVFKYLTFEYLVRPLDMAKLKDLAVRITNHLSKQKSKFHFSSKRINHILPQMEIIYFEKDGRSAYIHTKKGIFCCNKTIREIFEQLSDNFIRVHSSYIVNQEYIFKIEKNKLGLLFPNEKNQLTEIAIPIGRSFKKNIRDKFVMKM